MKMVNKKKSKELIQTDEDCMNMKSLCMHLIGLLDEDRNKYEQEENYEVCADLKNLIHIIGKFILGYVEFKSVRDIVLDLFKAKMLIGEVGAINDSIGMIDHGYAIIWINDNYFVIDLTPQEYFNFKKFKDLEQKSQENQ